MLTCPACASRVPGTACFCPECGAPLDLSSTPTRLQKTGSPRIAPDSPGALGDGGFVPGSMLAGRYRIVGLLGRGGMGDVYRADDLRLGQPVALKFLPASLARDPGSLERFHGEVRLARQVSHPNVCRVYDVGEADEQPFLSMEFVDGEDLASLLRRIGRLPGDKAAAREVGGLEARTAWSCLAVALGGLLTAVLLANRNYLVNYVPLAKPPEVLAGRFHDPLVGRDILVGSALGAAIIWLKCLGEQLIAWLGLPPPIPHVGNLADLVELRWCLGEVLDVPLHTLFDVMLGLFILLLMRTLLRREWVAATAFSRIFAFMVSGGGGENPAVGFPLTLLALAAWTYVLIRFGLVAGTVGAIWAILVDRMPLTSDFTAWYAVPTLVFLTVLAGAAVFGFRVALAGRTAFRLLADEAGRAAGGA